MDIKGRRDDLGITQTSLAQALGVSPQAVAKWERGTTLPRADKLPLLAKELGCTVDELLSEKQIV